MKFKIRPHQEVPIFEGKRQSLRKRHWLCMGEVSVQVTEPRRRSVRRPGPSQIKMYGFCRPFRTMLLKNIFRQFSCKCSPELAFFCYFDVDGGGGGHCAPPPPPPARRYTTWIISRTPCICAKDLKLSDALNDEIFNTQIWFSTSSAYPCLP